MRYRALMVGILILLSAMLSGCISDPEKKKELEFTEVTLDTSSSDHELFEGRVRLEFQTIDHAKDMKLNCAIMNDPPADPGLVKGTTFVIEPLDKVEFYAMITISYDPAYLPEDVDEEELTIGKVLADSFWAGVPTSTVDTENKTVSAAITQFSSFGILHPSGPRIGPVHSRIAPGRDFRMRCYAEPISGGTLVYEWNTTGRVGHFSRHMAPGRYNTYYTDPDAKGSDIITLEVFEEVGGKRTSLGLTKALVEVGYTDLMINPSFTQIMHDTNTTISVGFSPPMDDTMCLKIRWSSTGYNGKMTDGMISPSNAFESRMRQVVYMAGTRGGIKDKISARVSVDMGTGMGGSRGDLKETAFIIEEVEGEVFVIDIAPSGSIPHREYWDHPFGKVELSTLFPVPGGDIGVVVTWEGSSPEDEMFLYCAWAVDAKGSFKEGPMQRSSPKVGGVHNGGPDEIFCNFGGATVIISPDQKAVTFVLDSNITRSQLIHTSQAIGGGNSYKGPAVILWGNGWASGRLFEIDASGVSFT